MILRGETEKRIYIDEINTLIVQSTAVSLTAALLAELVKNGVKVIFCDEKYNPFSELTTPSSKKLFVTLMFLLP